MKTSLRALLVGALLFLPVRRAASAMVSVLASSSSIFVHGRVPGTTTEYGGT